MVREGALRAGIRYSLQKLKTKDTRIAAPHRAATRLNEFYGF